MLVKSIMFSINLNKYSFYNDSFCKSIMQFIHNIPGEKLIIQTSAIQVVTIMSLAHKKANRAMRCLKALNLCWIEVLKRIEESNRIDSFLKNRFF